MRFSDLLRTADTQPGEWTLEVPADWRQGRAVFGGLQTALGLSAMRDLVPSELPLRTLQTTFIAPPAGAKLSAHARVLRQGKSATHVQALLMDTPAASGEAQRDAAQPSVLAVVLGVFGAARPSQVRVTPMQALLQSDKPTSFNFVPGVTPTFTKHFEATWLSGGLPFSGTDATRASVEVGMPEEAHASEALLVALSDFMPPLGLSMLRTPAPGSSLTWMLELLTDRFSELPVRGFRIDAELLAARDGYTSQSGTVWGPDGTPLALSRQSMVVFG